MSLLSSVAERVNERRRVLKDGNSDNHNQVDFDAAVSQILTDKSIPIAMKTFMGIVVAKLGKIDGLIEENKKLRLEVEVLRLLCAEYNVVQCDRAKRKGGEIALMIRKIFSYNNVVVTESVDGGYDILCCDLATRDRLCISLLCGVQGT
ncbi:unnamed protein product [Heligmosomoides polygyrus]|uniref:Uncharacterized protein n=1 Tax=Heligmosomoides polygyrus TaxID=6339 RepID=A0A183G5Y7_HELPZ|nr:unnamed protein product [Heligmosomoides polygyrus]